MRVCLLFLAAALGASVGAQDLDLSQYHIIDLTHSFDEQTVYWPTSPSDFELEVLAHGHSEAGFFYAANAFCSPEHGGTHLDAPIHFAEGRMTVDQIPLEEMIGPAVVINVSARAADDPDYRLSLEDVEAFEARHGRIEPGTIVLLRTDWSRFWPDRGAYFATDTPDDATTLRFPSYGEAAARLLVHDRQVAMLGVDTASIDFGQSTDFIVHRIAAEENIPGLENLTNLDQLPARGAHVIALPMKIGGGSGAPARVIALVPNGSL